MVRSKIPTYCKTPQITCPFHNPQTQYVLNENYTQRERFTDNLFLLYAYCYNPTCLYLCIGNKPVQKWYTRFHVEEMSLSCGSIGFVSYDYLDPLQKLGAQVLRQHNYTKKQAKRCSFPKWHNFSSVLFPSDTTSLAP